MTGNSKLQLPPGSSLGISPHPVSRNAGGRSHPGKPSASQLFKVSFKSLPFLYHFFTIFHFEEDLVAQGPVQTEDAAAANPRTWHASGEDLRNRIWLLTARAHASRRRNIPKAGTDPGGRQMHGSPRRRDERRGFLAGDLCVLPVSAVSPGVSFCSSFAALGSSWKKQFEPRNTRSTRKQNGLEKKVYSLNERTDSSIQLLLLSRIRRISRFQLPVFGSLVSIRGLEKGSFRQLPA